MKRCLRANLQITEQDLSLADFRALLGVLTGKLTRAPDFLRRVVEPAVEEVNALSDFWVEITPLRDGGQLRGQLKGFRLLWKRKEKGEWQACLNELMTRRGSRAGWSR